jgi:hypothetical protein
MTRADRMRMAVQLPLEGARQPGSVVIVSLTAFHIDTARQLHRIGGRHNIRCLFNQGSNQTEGATSCPFLSGHVGTANGPKHGAVYTPSVHQRSTVVHPLPKKSIKHAMSNASFISLPPVKSDYSQAGFFLYPWQRLFRLAENASQRGGARR